MLNIPNNWMSLIMIHPFCLKEWKSKKLKILVPTCMIKREFVIYVRNLKQALNHELVLKKEHEDSLNLIKNLGKNEKNTDTYK